MRAKHVVVIGAGVIGLSTAYYAAQRGHRVTVLERNAAESEGCSFGNAGLIVPSHVVPLAAPGMIGLGMRWMLDSESPFFVRPRFDRDLIDWGWKFKSKCTAGHVDHCAPLLRDLHLASHTLFRGLAAGCENEFGLVEKGVVMLCATEAGLEEEVRAARRARDLGLAAEALTPRELETLEPDIAMNVVGGVLYPGDAHVVPARFMRSMQRRVGEAGVEIRWGSHVTGWTKSGAGITSVKTTQGEVAGDEFVVCGGSWSPEIVRDLGLRLPMQAGKGYSLTLQKPKQKPERGLILSEARIAVTPMGDTLRVGGTMEIAGLSERINPSRIRGIVKSVPRYLPEFPASTFEGVEPWSGLRPCSPDGLPYIGRFSRFHNLTAATGHAMMGLSLGPITGDLVAQMISGDECTIAMDKLSPDRFGLSQKEAR
jgi:D-amino-acid dehydrogenase